MRTDLVTLERGLQRLQLAPAIGGAVTRWDWKRDAAWMPLFLPWDGASDDRYTLACFPLVPWSNRIAEGGFEQDGVFYPMKLNKSGESYPIHGDAWLQPWKVAQQGDNEIILEIESHRFDDNPYDYRASQRFTLADDGLRIRLEVTHLGDKPLPYGLGLHPYFMRTARTLLQSPADGVWLAGNDPIPVRHTTEFPPGWDYNLPAPLEGEMIDNCFTGWPGWSVLRYPDAGLQVRMTMENASGYSLLYRPPGLPFICLEPITHPINAFHMNGRPGLVVLARGESLALDAGFTVSALHADA